MNIESIVDAQRVFFETGATKSLDFRKNALKNLRREMTLHEAEIYAALQSDLGKSEFEGFMCEVGLVCSELSYVEKHLHKWIQPRKVHTPLAQFAAKSFVTADPLGVCLIMSPWNYPYMLSLEPLIGAVAAGNCVILKPSAYAPRTSRVLADIVGAAFVPQHVAVIEGGRAENAALLEQKFDHIFFTGSVSVGRLVMEKAARHLTPVTLELGGKSPCIVDETADLKLAAKRIVFGKFINAGQTCVAPDYLMVHESVKDILLQFIKEEINAQYGNNPLGGKALGKIVNRKHYERILGLLDGQKIVCGGEHDDAALQIAPTVLDEVSPDSAVMQEEIFGPVLPVLSYAHLSEVISFVTQRDRPLALYFFTKDAQAEAEILRCCRFGGGCINDTIIHLATSEMGFGGVGESGMGSYHGKGSFDTFTHYKSIVKKACWMDLPVRYQPATPFKKKLLHFFLK